MAHFMASLFSLFFLTQHISRLPSFWQKITESFTTDQTNQSNKETHCWSYNMIPDLQFLQSEYWVKKVSVNMDCWLTKNTKKINWQNIIRYCFKWVSNLAIWIMCSAQRTNINYSGLKAGKLKSSFQMNPKKSKILRKNLFSYVWIFLHLNLNCII